MIVFNFTIVAILMIVFNFTMVAILAQVCFLSVAILAQVCFLFGPGVGLLWPASALLPLRAQTGITCFGARLPFLLHLLHEIECGFIGSLDPLTFTV